MPPGRPRILDDAKRREICALLSAGLEFHETARYVGCTPRTIRREISRNAVFRREVHDALLVARVAPEKLLRQAAGRNWRAAAWLLERTDPVAYSRRAPAGCSLEDLDAILRWLIEIALTAVEEDLARRDDLFDRMWAAAEDVKNQVVRRTNPRKPISTPPTFLCDISIALKQANFPPAVRKNSSAGGESGSDKNSAPFVSTREGQMSDMAERSLRENGQNSSIVSAETFSPRTPQGYSPNFEAAPRINSRSA
jgi:hypothetical protein